MRCPDCNKFVSFDEPQVEIQSVDVSDSELTVSARVSLNCADCGTELKEATIDEVVDLDHTCNDPAKPDTGYEDGDDQFTAEESGAEGTSRQETKDRNGKQIKSSRYMKTFYGFQADIDCHCCKCGADFSVSVEGEEQAGSFDELV